jgi:hypothetical protein
LTETELDGGGHLTEQDQTGTRRHRRHSMTLVIGADTSPRPSAAATSAATASSSAAALSSVGGPGHADNGPDHSHGVPASANGAEGVKEGVLLLHATYLAAHPYPMVQVRLGV